MLIISILNLGKVHLQVRQAVGLHQEEALMWRTEGNVSSDFCLFDFPQIQQATNNFSEENKLGQGGFGPVYKVWSLMLVGCIYILVVIIFVSSLRFKISNICTKLIYIYIYVS